MISYPSDLTDGQWDEIEPWVPELQYRYRLPYDERDVVNAIRYQYHQNCWWNELPVDFPPPDEAAIHQAVAAGIGQAIAALPAQESEAEHTTPGVQYHQRYHCAARHALRSEDQGTDITAGGRTRPRRRPGPQPLTRFRE
jgi:transposase